MRDQSLGAPTLPQLRTDGHTGMCAKWGAKGATNDGGEGLERPERRNESEEEWDNTRERQTCHGTSLRPQHGPMLVRQLRPHGRAKKKSSSFSAASHCHPCLGKPGPIIFERTSTWSLALCQRGPTGRAETNIHESVMRPDQCRQVMRRSILRQVVQDQVCNRRMSLADHLQPVSPTDEEGSRSTSDGTPQTHTKLHQAKQHPTTCSHNASHPLHDGQRTRVWRQGARSWGGEAAQKRSSTIALQIRDKRNPVQEDLMFSSDCDATSTYSLCPSGVPNTFTPRRSAGRVGSPLHSTAVWGPTLLAAAVNKWQPNGPDPASDVCVLPKWTSNAGISPQLTLDQIENRDNSVWSTDGVQKHKASNPGTTDSEQLPAGC